jgi:hypothetical protein
MAAPELIPLDMLKGHLRLPLDYTAEDDDLQVKLDQATVLVLDFVNQRVSDPEAWAETVAAWTEDTVPAQVQAAILNQAAYLRRFRGDDPSQDEPRGPEGYLPKNVTMWLTRLKDPALA